MFFNEIEKLAEYIGIIMDTQCSSMIDCKIFLDELIERLEESRDNIEEQI